MKHNDVSIIIQGPPNKTTLFSILNYKDLAEIIICFNNENDDTKEFEKLFLNKNIKIITYKKNVIKNEINNLNFPNAVYQFYSTKIGIDISTKKYCIKTRSDEFYENMDYFIQCVKNNENCVTTNDVFFRKFKFWKFSASDHLFGSSRKLMKQAFAFLLDSLKEKDENKRYNLYNYKYALKRDKIWYCSMPDNHLAMEQYITMSFLNAIKNNQNITDDGNFFNYDNFRKYFRKINVCDLGQHKVTHNRNVPGKPKFWINNFVPDKFYDMDDTFNITKFG